MRRLAARALWFVRHTVPDLIKRGAAAASPKRLIRRAMTGARPARGRLHEDLRRRYHARRLRQFMAPYLKEGGVAFDIGANEGEWTAAMRTLGARVIAVEPQAVCANGIRASFDGDSQVEVVESAVGDAPGRGTLHLAADWTQHASMSEEWRRSVVEHRGLSEGTWPETVEVPVTTMDALIEEWGSPAFSKIDVEGFEVKVLAGLSAPLPALAFEFHQEMLDKVRDCVARLEQLGEYRYTTFVDEWPDRIGGEVAAGEIADAVAALPPGAWGMIVARRA